MLKIALAQIAPVWLDRQATLDKIMDYVSRAAKEGAGLVVFGETILPGYPFWLDGTGGARFNDPVQKDIFAHYAQEAVDLERGDLDPLCAICREQQIAAIVGVLERPRDRGGFSCYCSLVYVDQSGTIANVHRKLQPTYEERLVWSPGDGHGLRVQELAGFKIGGLNCWENWMPLPRAALYGLGESLHVAIWPGNVRNTEVLTRFLAREGRSYCVSVSGLMSKEDIPAGIPHRELIAANFPDMPADGGSCLAAPDGSWIIEPIAGKESLVFAELDPRAVVRERQNFDPAGHYSRPDVTQLTINRDRQSTIRIKNYSD
ncbi:carbon-nitrogen hydrolase family protein [Lewinella sp. W8]|uniref:carbon-nitrogen hydrolase family protein n=1 Tax=Lewinella sp. W8 TaxID=2528208 RepID=UPI001067B03D|nr:carbon-nitrogen hydrolase family protein [Lewinella sp. W8]MTB50467.1 carbon-nitrogen hydrolase family protein [Lewinella sp. W8]